MSRNDDMEDFRALAPVLASDWKEYERISLKDAESPFVLPADEQEMKNKLEQGLRALAKRIIDYRGQRPNYEFFRDTRLRAREVLRRLGALESLRPSGIERVKIDELPEDDPRRELPEDLQGRRSIEYAQGYANCKTYVSAALDSGLPFPSDSESYEARDVSNNYYPETFKSSDYEGGWNECDSTLRSLHA